MREDCEWFTVGLSRTKLRDNSKLRSRRNMHRNTVELDLRQPETNDGFEEEEILYFAASATATVTAAVVLLVVLWVHLLLLRVPHRHRGSTVLTLFARRG